MNNLLIFFAIPVATIILSVVLQKILKCPILVAATFFAIFLILSFTVVPSTSIVLALILTIIYTILSFITALIVKFICKLRRMFDNDNNCSCCDDLSITNDNNLVTVSNGCTSSSENIMLSDNITSNTINTGRAGEFRGCYRRR